MKDYIYLINKKKGISSFKAMSSLKKLDDVKKVGHAGTLDPMAEGLILSMINDATKLSDDLMHKDKTYEVSMILGYETETLDLEGKIINYTKDECKFTDEEIKEKIKSFEGVFEQIPPKYSALKINGKKLYELARNNEITDDMVEIKKRKVNILSIEDIEIENDIKVLEKEITENFVVYFEYVQKVISFKVRVSSGTYIRSLVRDIGYRLDSFGTMSKLKRTSIGDFTLEDVDKKISIENLISNKKIDVSKEDSIKLKNGMKIEIKGKYLLNDILNVIVDGNFVGLVIVLFNEKEKTIVKKYKYFDVIY